jgi:tRNA (mo5U34)-methyltransferase
MSPQRGDAAPIEDLSARVAALGYWYHKIDLPGGIVTPGWAPIDPAAYRVPDDLTGKRVLDVGAWDGYWTFEALNRGASEVVAIDDFSDLLSRLETRTGWGNFDLCRDALGYSDAQCKRHDISVYDVTEAQFGRFDYVFCFGLLYHLRHPLLALDRLAAICDEAIFVESAILDDYSPYRGGLGHGYADGQMVMEFYPDSQYGNNATNYWVPTLHCLGQMVRSAGFAHVDGEKLVEKPEALPHCRGIVVGRKNPKI